MYLLLPPSTSNLIPSRCNQAFFLLVQVSKGQNDLFKCDSPYHVFTFALDDYYETGLLGNKLIGLTVNNNTMEMGSKKQPGSTKNVSIEIVFKHNLVYKVNCK